jgi:hypothetical protein
VLDLSIKRKQTVHVYGKDIITKDTSTTCMFGTNLICYHRPKAGYKTERLHFSFGHAESENNVINT